MLILEIALDVLLGGWALIASVAYCSARRARRGFANKMRGLEEDQILMLIKDARISEEMVAMVDNMLEHHRTMRTLLPENQVPASDQARD